MKKEEEKLYLDIVSDVYEIDFKLHFNPSICIRFSFFLLFPSSSSHFSMKLLAAIKFANLFRFDLYEHSFISQLVIHFDSK